MAPVSRVEPWWAVLTAWSVVNGVNVLQEAWFLSRLRARGLDVNRTLGVAIAALALPAAAALVALARAGAGWRHCLGPVVFLAFVAVMVAADYVWPLEFRHPARPAVLIPYLLPFFCAILVMGLPMFAMDRRLWLVTAATTGLLLLSMGAAMRAGVG